ncbi:hypothetical protein ABZ845_29680 [Streptomyces sp. NPDC047022]|uniref:hypothetical protein n=1 Tax=Streptomyces sp. NPDC047022 TaxID=3155737 RepID=UPI0034088AA6
MRLKQVSLSAAISLVAGLTTATVGLTGSAAWADSTAALPLSHFAHMLVDTAHQHIFFSQGAGSSGIVVTDLSGNPVTTLADEPGATGLALSADGGTLYAALADGDAVAAIDTAKLTESARWTTGTGSAPVSVAVAGGKVWYAYTDSGKGAIGSVDPAASEPAATPQPSMSSWRGAPLLATGGGVLVAQEPGQSISRVATFDVSSGTASPKADMGVYVGTASGLQVAGDGSKALFAGPKQAALVALRTSDLMDAGPPVYYTGGLNSAPDSLALGADGSIAVGSNPASAAGLYFYGGSNLAENHIAFPSGTTVAADGLQWGADSATLYAVTQDTSGTPGSYTLNVLNAPNHTDTQLSLAYPRTAYPTQQYTITGSLSTKGIVPAGAALAVTRDGTPLPDATVGKDGSFSISDTRPQEGAYTYQVSYAGDATHGAAQTSMTLNLTRLSTSIPYPDFTAATPGSVAFTGSLMTQFGLGSLPQGTTVQVSRTNEDTQQTTQLPPVTVDPATTEFTVEDAPHTAGQFTYHLSYEGDVTHQPASADVFAKVSPYAPALTLKAPKTATRGSALTFGGTLSDAPYDSGETVTVTRTDAAHTTTPVKWTAPLAPDGTVTIKDTPTIGGTVTYTIGYAGDASHQAATASAIVQVSRAATALSLTTDASSYAYGATATATAHLGTTYNGRTVSIYAQPYGGTKTLVKTGTVDSHGNLTATYKLSHNTAFTASFAGDYQYAPATASHTAYDQAKVAESLSGYYTSTTYSGITYRVYHHTAKPVVGATVTPGKSGQCVNFQVQEYYSSAWHTLSTTGCYHLDSHSVAAVQLTLTNAVNQKFRVRSEYTHSTSDNTNLSTWGGWAYLTVRT